MASRPACITSDLRPLPTLSLTVPVVGIRALAPPSHDLLRSLLRHLQIVSRTRSSCPQRKVPPPPHRLLIPSIKWTSPKTTLRSARAMLSSVLPHRKCIPLSSAARPALVPFLVPTSPIVLLSPFRSYATLSSTVSHCPSTSTFLPISPSAVYRTVVPYLSSRFLTTHYIPPLYASRASSSHYMTY